SVAGTAGHRDIISIDVGGTSADICLVREGRPEITKEGMIGPFPLKLPMIDIHTIGAGGGSIAAVSAAGRLTVGPRSAGAEPGPVCYGRGGAEPTVTDAHLVLGRIPPALLAGRLAELLEIPTVIIPPRPGVLSTWGLLDTDMRATFVRTVGTAERHLGEGPAAARGVDVKPLEATWGELEAQARAWLDTEEIPRDRQRFERSADLRYEHQSFELTCPLGEGVVTTARLAELTATFHAEHRRLYTYDLPDAP